MDNELPNNYEIRNKYIYMLIRQVLQLHDIRLEDKIYSTIPQLQQILLLRGTSVNNVSLYDFSLLPVEIQIGIPLMQYFRGYGLRAEPSNGKHENEIV